MNISDFKEKLFNKAKDSGFTEYEMYFTEGSSFEVKIFKGEISQYKNTSYVGVSFRGSLNNQMGYSFTEKVDDDVIDYLIKNAKDNAGLLEDKDIEKINSEKANYRKKQAVNVNDISTKEKINLAMELEKYAYTVDKRVKTVDYCLIATGKERKYIANSHGLELDDNDDIAFAYVSAIVTENESTKVGSNVWYGVDFSDFDYKNLAKQAVEKGINSLNATQGKTGTYNIILNNECTTDLLSTFAGVFYGEKVQKGFSILNDKIGTVIASDKITINDDVTCKGSIVDTIFDSEGVAGFNKKVIEKGVLKTYLHNMKSAEKDGIKSTGNGFRGSFKSSIGTETNNFYIEPTNISFADMVKKLNNGVLITSLSGLHSGANIISGDFSLLAEGFNVEDGVIKDAIDQITIAGNFYELLKNVEEVGADIWFDMPSGGGSIGAPSIIVKDMSIAGK